MAAILKIYKNNPTESGTDGTAVSQDGAQTSPVTVTLDATQSETETVKLALRCDAGYTTTGNTVISFTGTTAAKWSVCATEDGTYASSLTISDAIGATNKIFYVKATSASTEMPTNDTSVSIQLQCKLAQAE